MKKYIFRKKPITSLKTQVAITFAIGLSAFLYGCNTMEGAGTDIQKAGKSLEDSAKRNK